MSHFGPEIPPRQIRASFDGETVIVYQAFSSQIAEPALAGGRFVPPFRLNRMTWIKPSFLWMMYRSGWATKPGQERVLAVAITRIGFEWALSHSSLSHYATAVYATEAEWVRAQEETPVRIQWDPERTLQQQPRSYRTIQIGLVEEAVRRYVNDWTVRIEDVTGLAHTIHDLVVAGELSAANEIVPRECPYPLPKDLIAMVGATSQPTSTYASHYTIIQDP
jgi:hypothetical protein